MFVAEFDPFAALADFVPDGLVVVEQDAALIDVVDLRAGAEHRLAARGCLHPEHDPQQGCLAHTVAPNDAEALAGFEIEIEPVEQRAAVGQVVAGKLQLDHPVGQLGRGRDDEVHVEFLLGAGLGGERVVTLDAVHGLRAARLGAAADPFEFALEKLLARGLGGLGVGQPGRFVFEESGVVALVREERAAGQFDDAVGHAVQEIAVVRDEQTGARIVLEETPPATRWKTCRGGSSARRGSAGRAGPAARGRGRRGVFPRRRVGPRAGRRRGRRGG